MAKRRHNKNSKSLRWVLDKYWRRDTSNGRNRDLFSTKEGHKIRIHADTPIKRFVKVQRYRSVYDGDWAYWSQRNGKHPEIPLKVATLLKRQKGKCTHCGLYFSTTDLMEIDHIIPKSKGGNDYYDNLQLLHSHCHDTKTATDGSYERSINDNDYSSRGAV